MRYKIAGCITEYTPIYEILSKKMEPYLYEGEGETDICLNLTKNFCETKQKEQPHLTIPQCEYIFVGSQFYRKFLLQGGFMLHASAVEVEGKAYLFSADSGTGKSTHTKQWQAFFGGERALIINDDKPAVRKEVGQWFAYGTPFSGKTDENLNRKVKLQGICMLERGEMNQIKQIDAGEAIALLMKQTLVPRESEGVGMLLNYLDELLKEVPIYRMQCTISEEAAKMAYRTMRGEM